MSEQTWLSLTGICNVLKTNERHIRWLVKNGYLEMLPGKQYGFAHGRFLDPTPGYAERLRLAAIIHHKRVPLPEEIDLSEKAIFTRAEIAAILGWTDQYARQYLKEHDLPSVKLGRVKHGGLRLYTAKTVRELLWRRQGRKTSAQRAPFLITDLIDWFHKQTASEAAIVPTDAELAEDEVMQKKLAAILRMRSPLRERAMRELWEKVELARQTVGLLQHSDESRMASGN